MWVNAQRDGRPAEHRWRPLFNAASLADAHYLTAKTRNPLKVAGVPQTPEPISAVSGPKFTILWGHLDDILLLNKFFVDCRATRALRRHSPTKLCDGAHMAIFSEPRAAHFRPAF